MDELDSLLGKGEKGEKVLHTLVEWVSRPHSRLLLVGIANTIDLSQRVRQRTQSRFEGESIVFQPYNASDILEVTCCAASIIHQKKTHHRCRFSSLACDLSCPTLGKMTHPQFSRDRRSRFAPEKRPTFLVTFGAHCICATWQVSTKPRTAPPLRPLLLSQVRAVDRLKTRLQSGQTQEPLISITHMSECLMAMRTTPFATLVQNASLFEKVFLIAVAREMAASGTQGGVDGRRVTTSHMRRNHF